MREHSELIVSLVVRDAEVAPGRRADVRCESGTVTAIGEQRPVPGDEVVDAAGGALLKGLHDHHLHLLAHAAARASVDVADGRLEAAVRVARADHPDGWLRAVGWPGAVRGPLDRERLDRLDRAPLRVLDGSGSTWYLNSAALDLVLDGPPPPGVELDGDGRPTGRLFRLDDWLRTRTGASVPAELRAAAADLAARGVTSLTDATATNDNAELALLAAADLPQRLTAMTHAAAAVPPDGVRLGPVKVLLDDAALPELVTLAAIVREAHDHHRAIAVHCVTRVQLVVTLAALGWAGSAPGDRIEHGAVVPDDLVGDLRAFGLTVVTQPGFLADRGDTYLDEVEADDRPWLYRVAGLLAAGVPVLGSSDAPFGPADPWVAIAAAVDRRAPDGRQVVPHEAVDVPTALGLYDSGPVQVGDPADLAVLAGPWAHLLTAPGDVEVAHTVVGGRLVRGRERD